VIDPDEVSAVYANDDEPGGYVRKRTPTLQGRSLSLSPVVILLSLSFWSWMWGVAGALIAIPLTVALLIVFDHFRTTKWITQLVSRPSS
jgi:predicted PurR-regulated permease PerM